MIRVMIAEDHEFDPAGVCEALDAKDDMMVVACLSSSSSDLTANSLGHIGNNRDHCVESGVYHSQEVEVLARVLVTRVGRDPLPVQKVLSDFMAFRSRSVASVGTPSRRICRGRGAEQSQQNQGAYDNRSLLQPSDACKHGEPLSVAAGASFQHQTTI